MGWEIIVFHIHYPLPWDISWADRNGVIVAHGGYKCWMGYSHILPVHPSNLWDITSVDRYSVIIAHGRSEV
jgi:hypothetical protein